MRIRKDDDNDIIKNIRESFIDPLANIDPIELNSEAEAEQETTKINSELKSNDWTAKSQAIQRALSLLKGNAVRFQSFNLTEIVSNSSLAILDVRSTLVKHGTLLITAAAKIMRDNFAVCADFVIPNLFKQTNCGKLFISGSCKHTIFAIVENTQKPRIFKTIMTESVSKSAAKRLIVAESIVIALQEWPKSIVMSIQDIQKVISTLISDPSQEVRENARLANSLYEGTPVSYVQSPDTTLKRISKIPESQFGSVKKVNRKYQPFTAKTPKGKSLFILPSIDQTSMFEIDQVMPPQDEAAADQFCKLLVSIVKSESFFALEGLEFALPSSIIAASKLSSAFGSVIVMIPQLFSTMPEEFKDNVAEIIITTKINKRIIKRAFEQFGESIVINNFVGISSRYPEETIQFFTEIIKNNYVIKLDSETETFLKQFMATVNCSSEVLLQYFATFEGDFENHNQEKEDFDKIFGNLKNFILGEKFNQNEIHVSDVENFKIYIENNSKSIVDLLNDSNNMKINLALTFLIESLTVISKNKNSDSFTHQNFRIPDLYQPLFDLIQDQKHLFSGKAMKSLELMCFNVDDLFSYLKSKDYYEVSLSFLANRIQQDGLLDSSILANYSELGKILLPYINDQKVSTRRHCIMILSKISSLTGMNFQSLFVEMTPIQQKLVNFYQDKMFANNSQKDQ
ncbi:hypothetical protein TRFO_14447 [Tritrichomonas foetus]|uniref:TOG domain-containing protein n=1 Tax=Tritrichomonas foetus TaxID=1144522 RepID=A0A1J4KW38_9EUKA|nr:hypothetical protein TRFO_14447 [Tritrichomonas foetus]|eukprot:OHT15096.1 hypothetical protein TRFO_14447 [Tritrichomonas foetus]